MVVMMVVVVDMEVGGSRGAADLSVAERAG